ncbi:DegT/DnrJ/EryC1/StrS family aminotransferase [Catenuloplanes sp. NPDC051500]|uniref:DegT/DnrJ/EryC1/StrS family aminotransferase n=1 Tax=Catenuloplanes sp. NPDC051500 TaxID=3363959 RepID=UPI0037B651DF
MLALLGGPPVLRPDELRGWPGVTAEDEAAVVTALRDATPWRWPMRAATELEEAWSELTGAPYVLAVNSGTAALHMALTAAGVRPGDEVLVPADTFGATAQAVLHAGARPVFVDSDPMTYTIDPVLAASAVTPLTRAVLPVDLHGLPAGYDALGRIGLAVVEDGAQAHGATYRGRPVGVLGDAAGLSLNGSKTLSSLGEAGLFCTADREGFRRAQALMTFGEDPDAAAGDMPEVMSIGWNYRIHVLGAAFARSQLSRLREMSGARTANGAALTEALAGIPGLRLPTVPDDRTHVYFLYPLLVVPEELEMGAEHIPAFRDVLREAATAEGLPISRWQTKPLPRHRLFRTSARFPVAEDICARRLVIGHSTCPIGPPHTPATMRRIARVFEKILVTEKKTFRRLVNER